MQCCLAKKKCWREARQGFEYIVFWFLAVGRLELVFARYRLVVFEQDFSRGLVGAAVKLDEQEQASKA